MEYGQGNIEKELSLGTDSRMNGVRRLRGEMEDRKLMMARTHGKSAALRMCMEERILSQFQRLPGIPSSLIGLNTLLGKDTEFGFEDYLDDPEFSSFPDADLHSLMTNQ